MTSSFTRTLKNILTASALTLAAPALAHEPAPRDGAAERSVEERFELLLETIDVVPESREAFETAFPGARERLDAAARDTRRSTWQRVRAVTMLSYFPDTATRQTLELLSTPPSDKLSQAERARALSADVEVRRQALYTLGRAFGPTADAGLVRFIEARIAAEPVLEVREHGLRSLRWVDGEEARAALSRLANHKELGKLAGEVQKKRNVRLASPRLGH